jgi:hypothetical protein
MSATCIKCREPFSKKELKKFAEEAEYCEVRYICDDCFQIEEYSQNTPEETFSDADPGL